MAAKEELRTTPFGTTNEACQNLTAAYALFKGASTPDETKAARQAVTAATFDKVGATSAETPSWSSDPAQPGDSGNKSRRYH